ncbi:hypothetical protein TUM4438_13280 [Shewanella sairae]|uniref:Adenosine deaminase n=1 Tax=Shewanella sairae TaxID=190310 RepID=A0ABQ4P890_9GAMM|nr:antiviral RADAR system adenosine deaminase RdrB [Shewanella sairae]MCL1130672.1 hypothetical protein [Shewanella sairae]GIU43728.1 hypothetical protein TUM4438_13280 [Shewanella sairae]
MITIDIQWLVPVVLLSSDRLLDVGLQSSNPEDQINTTKKLKNHLALALQDYQCYLETPLRKEDVEFALGNWLDDENNIDINIILEKMYRYFLDWCGDHFEVKPERLEEWLSVVAMLDPAWIIGFGYVELLKGHILGLEQLYGVIEHQCPSALPKRFDGKPVADNHVHLNGHGHNSLSLVDFALYLTKKPETKRCKWPYRQECSLFNSEKLDLTLLPVMVNQLFSSLVKEHWGESDFGIPNWGDLEFVQFNTDILVTLEMQEAKTQAQSLLASSHLIQVSEPVRWLILPIAVMLESRDLGLEYTKKLTAFIRACNLLRNYMVVSGVGLGRFVDYFSFKLRKPTGANLSYKAHSLSHDFSASTYREFRGSPNLVVHEKWKKNKSNFKLLPKELTQFANELTSKNLDARSHFVIHFARGYSTLARQGDQYQLAYRGQLLTQVRKLQQFFSSTTYSDIALHSDSDSDSTYADLRALVRGFDVAGNENELPIEVFAPTLRVLRAGKHEHQSKYDSRLRQPFLTIHAGEDYGHLLSGLRAIDEAVQFCNFKAGDRLGHGLALGVDVYDWARKQQRVYLTAGQHLDNLVWFYFQALEVAQHQSEFNPILSILENKIHRWSGYIFGDEIKATPSDLYQAWKLRRNCPLMQTLPNQAAGSEWELWVPDMLYLEKNKSSVAVRVWQRYLNKELFRDSVGSLRCDDIVTIDCRNLTHRNEDEDALCDTLSRAELRLMHAIQDLLIERYSKRQVVLEACPTSNIFIGRFKRYVEHPIFRWNPPIADWLQPGGRFNTFGIRKGPINVCINTDDAGLMPTTIENEHRILKQTAISELDVGCFDADMWVDRIRQIGVDLFKSNHLDWINSTIRSNRC